jgi:adenylate cyclase
MGRLLTNRWVHFILLFIMLLTAVYYSGSHARWRMEMQSIVFDELNHFAPRAPTDQVVIVNIDDDSLLEAGQWPWPRTTVADLVTNLKSLGARAIVFDGVLAEPDRSSPHVIADALEGRGEFDDAVKNLKALPDHDDVLAQAIKDTQNFVAGFTWGSYTQNRQHRKPQIKQRVLAKKAEKKVFIDHVRRFDQAASFLPALEKAAVGNGSFMALADNDGVLRRAGLLFTDGKQLYPSLNLEAVRVAAGKPWRSARISANEAGEDSAAIDTAYRLHFDEYQIPVEADGMLYVYYRKFDERGDDYVSAYKVIDDQHHGKIEHLIKDRIVLIGASAEGLKDLRSTAIEQYQAGVEIHANVIEQILQGEYLLRPDITRGAEAFFIFVTGLTIIILAPFINAMVLFLFCAALVCGSFIGSAVAYVDHGLLLDPFYASLCIVVIFMVSVLFTYLRVEGEKKQVRNAFGLYISPDFMKDLTKNPDKLKLGGEIRDLSVLFSDIRSFTSISEGLTPEELIQLMNDFLTPMSDLVMQNRGTIDKYMGDAMMAFWNAPLDDAQHARNACITALGMQAALDPVNEAVRIRAEEAGREPVLLNAGIGINSGPCAVGNMGSCQRFAYSTLGDAVNLASRLESQTKNYGVNILIGESTRNEVPDFATLEMDLIKVKGKENAERIFVLLGDTQEGDTPEFLTLQKAHEALIEAYRGARFEEAQRHLSECRIRSSYNLGVAYDLYEKRIADMVDNPPPADWDGVFTATEK